MCKTIRNSKDYFFFFLNEIVRNLISDIYSEFTILKKKLNKNRHVTLRTVIITQQGNVKIPNLIVSS